MIKNSDIEQSGQQIGERHLGGSLKNTFLNMRVLGNTLFHERESSIEIRINVRPGVVKVSKPIIIRMESQASLAKKYGLVYAGLDQLFYEESKIKTDIEQSLLEDK